MKALLRDAARKLTAHRRRAFVANVAVELLGGSARRAQSHFGWNRDTVELGLHERASGIRCLDNFGARGSHKSESKLPKLERDIRALADPHSQADPQFKSALSLHALECGERAPGSGQGEGLARGGPAGRAYDEHHSQPLGLPLAQRGQDAARKKTEHTEAIFANVRQVNAAADADPACLRLSVDTKASVVLGDYSRRGKARGLAAVHALGPRSGH